MFFGGMLNYIAVLNGLVAGTLAFTGFSASGQIISTVATGTAPFVVASTTKVANLNADLLDGFDTSQAATANTVAVRNSSGYLFAVYNNQSSGLENPTIGSVFVENNAADGYLRKISLPNFYAQFPKTGTGNFVMDTGAIIGTPTINTPTISAASLTTSVSLAAGLVMTSPSQTSVILIQGGTNNLSSGLALWGGSFPTGLGPGAFELIAKNATAVICGLTGQPTGQLAWTGNLINISNANGYVGTGYGAFQVGGVPALTSFGNYRSIQDPAGASRLTVGNASDPNNYYDNTGHVFRNAAATTVLASLNSSGQFFATYFNQSSALENPTIGGVFVENSAADGYHRKITPTNFMAQIVTVSTTAQTPTAGSGAFTTVSATVTLEKVLGTRFYFVQVQINITTNGTAGGFISVPLGITASKESILVGRCAVLSGNEVQGIVAATASTITILKYDNTYPGASGERITLTGLVYV